MVLTWLEFNITPISCNNSLNHLQVFNDAYTEGNQLLAAGSSTKLLCSRHKAPEQSLNLHPNPAHSNDWASFSG